MLTVPSGATAATTNTTSPLLLRRLLLPQMQPSPVFMQPEQRVRVCVCVCECLVMCGPSDGAVGV